MQEVETHQETYILEKLFHWGVPGEMTVGRSRDSVGVPRPTKSNRRHRRHLCKSFTTTSYGEAIMRSQKDCLETGPNSLRLCSGL